MGSTKRKRVRSLRNILICFPNMPRTTVDTFIPMLLSKQNWTKHGNVAFWARVLFFSVMRETQDPWKENVLSDQMLYTIYVVSSSGFACAINAMYCNNLGTQAVFYKLEFWYLLRWHRGMCCYSHSSNCQTVENLANRWNYIVVLVTASSESLPRLDFLNCDIASSSQSWPVSEWHLSWVIYTQSHSLNSSHLHWDRGK